MSTEVKSYVPDQLLFSRSPKILSYIKERRANRVFPNGKTDAWAQSQVMDFEIRSDSLIDLPSTVLNFDLDFDISGGVSGASRISNACDIIQSIRVFYNDVQVEEILDANAFANLFLAYSANKTYLESEGETYLGLYNQFVQADSNGARSYSIPLTLVSGFFRSSQSLLPCMGNRIRVSITLATDGKVVSFSPSVSESYKLNKVSLTYDETVVSEKFRKMVMDAMMSESGIRIPFTSLQNTTLNVGAVSTAYLRLQFNLSNVLSMHMLVDNASAKSREANKYILACQSYPLTNFSKAFVRVGSQNLTPADGLKNYIELYQQQNKTISNFNDLLGTGVISYKDLVAGYTKAATVAGGAYGLCPVSIDCSKIVSNDDGVVNQGISSSGVNEFNIELYKSSGTFSADDVVLCGLVHKRSLVFSQGGALVEF